MPSTKEQRKSLIKLVTTKPTDWIQLHEFIKGQAKGSQKAEASDSLKEHICDMTHAESSTLWEGIRQISADALCQIADDNDNDENYDAKAFEIGVQAVKTILSLVVVALNSEDDFTPDGLIATVGLFHDIVLAIAGRCMDLAKEVTAISEKWWCNNFPAKHLYISNSLVLLLQLCLSDQGSQVIVKRLWETKDALLLHNLTANNAGGPEVSKKLRTLLLLTPQSLIFLKSDFGKRFLSFLFTLEGITDPLHSSFKDALRGASRTAAEGFGDVYFRTWKSLADDKEKLRYFEENCIQDLLYLAVHLKHKSAGAGTIQSFKNFFRAFEQKKDVKQVDAMLYRQLQPFIWRSIVAPNSNVRHQAAGMFLLLLPFKDFSLKAADSEQLMLKQCDAVEALLKDPCPIIRTLAIHESARLSSHYWDSLPRSFLKSFMSSLIQVHAFDVSSADVRVAVYQGLRVILDNAGSHLVLEKLLPKIGKYGINDKTEKVRLNAVKLLLSLRGLRTLKFWDIVPVDDILLTLSVEKSPPVCKAITELLMSSFCPLNKGLDVRLQRTAHLVKSDYEAARKFYVYVGNFLDMQYSTEQIMLLLQGVYMCVRKAKENMDADSDSSSVSSGDTTSELLEELENKENQENGVSEVCDATDLKLMNGLLDCAGVMWIAISDKLQNRQNMHLKTRLYKMAGRVLQSFIQFFKDTRLTDSLFVMARLVPPNHVQYVSKHVLKRLQAMKISNSPEDDRLEKEHQTLVQAACVWRLPELVNMVNEWLDSCLSAEIDKRRVSSPPPLKKTRVVKFRSLEKEPPKPRQGLMYLVNVVEDQAGRQALLKEHSHLLKPITERLEAAKEVIGGFLRCDDFDDLELVSRDDLVYSLRLLYTLKSVSVETEEEKRKFLDWLKQECDWVMMNVIPAFHMGDQIGEESNGNEERGRIALEVTKKFLVFVRHLLMVDLMSDELLDQVSGLLKRLMPSNISFYLHTEVAEVLFNVGEWSVYNGNSANTPDRVFELFQPFAQGLMNRFRSQSDDLPEFERKAECAEALRETVLCVCVTAPPVVARPCTQRIIGAMMAATVSDLTAAIQRTECVENPGDSDFECPLLADFLLRLTMQRHPKLVRSMASQLEACITSGALTERTPLHKLGAACQMLYYLKNAKCPRAVVKDVVGVIGNELKSLSEEEKESDLFVQVVDLLKSLER